MFPAGYDLNTGAVTIAYFVPTNTPGNQAYGGGLGLDFDVVQPVIVSELGCFDDNGNGIAVGTTITVSLWRRNNAGTPDIANDDTGAAILARTNFPDDVAIESGMVTRAIKSAQSQVEARNAEIRKNVLKYDDVLNRQREAIYSDRRHILEGDDLHVDVTMGTVRIQRRLRVANPAAGPK